MTAEDNIARKVTAYLDHGVADMRAGTTYRLAQARAAALARLDPAYATSMAAAPAFAGAGARAGSGPRGWSAGPVRWLGIALIVGAGVFGWQQWRAVQQVHELQDLDLQILSSDLPLDAYLDRGFLNWLRDDSDR
jgi:hypothetical protein